jgi:hypothetical protein
MIFWPTGLDLADLAASSRKTNPEIMDEGE